MTVKQVLGVAVGSLFILLVGSIGFTTYTLSKQKDDGLQINLAGRQRMFSQRMTKEALLLNQASTAENQDQWRNNFASTVKSFDRTLIALNNGGTTIGATGEEVSLPPAKDPHVMATLASGIELWDSLKPSLGPVADGTYQPGSPEFAQSLAQLTAGNLDLLKAMNAATGAFQKASDAKRGVLSLVQDISIVLGILLTLMTFWMVTKRLVSPLQQVLAFAQVIADGNLSNTLDTKGIREIHDLGTSMNSMSQSLGGMVRSIFQNATALNDSSAKLMNQSEQVSGLATDVSQDLNTVGSAVEEMSASMKTVAGSSTGIDEAISTVAAAIEEMSASLREVSNNTTHASQISGEAAEITRTTKTTVSELENSAQEISKVVELISEVANQTNLLALNATIEAASAGEAGKGFAVVANEVKELARQTNSATEEIRSQVQKIQATTGDVTTAIIDIAKIIEDVNDVNGNISTSVGQQSEAVNEISDSVQRLSENSGYVSRNVTEAATAITEISSNLQGAVLGVAEISSSMVKLAGDGNHHHVDEGYVSAQDLTNLAAELQGLVANFKV